MSILPHKLRTEDIMLIIHKEGRVLRPQRLFYYDSRKANNGNGND